MANFTVVALKMWAYSGTAPEVVKMVIFGTNLLFLMENSGGSQKKFDIGARLQIFLYPMSP